MLDNIKNMLARYSLTSTQDCNQALREIIQEIALVGLWRAKFFESAAFYGGTALRILYGLDRFSEDLNFSLLESNEHFSLDSYNKAITKELVAHGFTVDVQTKKKSINSSIESAFIKKNTKQELIRIGIPKFFYQNQHAREVIKIKLEVDTDPPLNFSTEAKTISDPIPVSINTYIPSDLFAGKMHAVLCRSWKNRVKGRDWYDFVWFIRRDIPLNLVHLETRMKQSGHLASSQALRKEDFLELLTQKISQLDIARALDDIRPFVRDVTQVSSWSQDYFLEFASRVRPLEG